jgi:predicted small lipoprotein YifL
LQIDNDLASVCKCKGHHAAHALVINIGQACVIDPIATRLDVFKETLGVVHVVSVSHYNFTMLLNPRILVSAMILAPIAVILAGCGQQGPLYLPTEPAAANRATLPESLMPFQSDDSNKPSVKDNTLAPKTPQ